MQQQLKISNKIKPFKQPLKKKHREKIRKIILGSQDLTKVLENQVQSQQFLEVGNFSKLCTDLLQKGYIDRFIDIFYLTHGGLPNKMHSQYSSFPSYNYQIQDIDMDFKMMQKLQFIDTNDGIRNQINIYQKLANQSQDLLKKYYFLCKILNISKTYKIRDIQLQVLLQMAQCFVFKSEYQQATVLTQKAYRQSNSNSLKQIQVGNKLIKIYEIRAQKSLNFQQSLQNYTKALKLCICTNNKPLECQIRFRIEELYYLNRQYECCIKHSKEYLSKLQQIKQQEKYQIDSSLIRMIKVHLNIGRCYSQMNNRQSALNEYLYCHHNAEKHSLNDILITTSLLLAQHYEEINQKSQFQYYYQLYYQAALKTGKRAIIDNARVACAVAKATCNMKNYMQFFTNQDPKINLQRITAWKNNKNNIEKKIKQQIL